MKTISKTTNMIHPTMAPHIKTRRSRKYTTRITVYVTDFLTPNEVDFVAFCSVRLRRNRERQRRVGDGGVEKERVQPVGVRKFRPKYDVIIIF